MQKLDLKVKIRKSKPNRFYEVAFGTIEYYGLAISVKLKEKKDGGLWLEWPKNKWKSGDEWKEIGLVIPTSKELNTIIRDAVTDAYYKLEEEETKEEETKDKKETVKKPTKNKKEEDEDEDIPF